MRIAPLSLLALIAFHANALADVKPGDAITVDLPAEPHVPLDVV